jgi:predicted RNase H-like nuclease (RuvC/YqgF family)
MVEIFKIVSSILGCILSAITLCSIIIKPIRQSIIKQIGKWSNKEAQDKAIQEQNKIIEKQNEAIKKEDEAIQEIKDKVNQIADIVSELSDRIFRNEADRLRSELFDCGNRCRRGIPLSGEEFRHIQDVFRKYSDELKCNGIGEDEYNFVKDYFNSKANQDRLNKKYDN